MPKSGCAWHLPVRRSNTRQLRASGGVLTQLAGALDGQLFSNVVWRMTLQPDAAAAKQSYTPADPAAARPDAPAADPDAARGAPLQQPAELPYHRRASPPCILKRAPASLVSPWHPTHGLETQALWAWVAQAACHMCLFWMSHHSARCQWRVVNTHAPRHQGGAPAPQVLAGGRRAVGEDAEERGAAGVCGALQGA